jgi:hypothetical protein
VDYRVNHPETFKPTLAMMLALSGSVDRKLGRKIGDTKSMLFLSALILGLP